MPGHQLRLLRRPDVVRHRLVSAIIRAYDARGARAPPRTARPRASVMPVAIDESSARVPVARRRVSRARPRAPWPRWGGRGATSRSPSSTTPRSAGSITPFAGRAPDGRARLSAGDAGPEGWWARSCISAETAHARQRRLGVPSTWSSTLLVTHGVLHLVGYDDRDPVEADLMHRRERDILGRDVRVFPPASGPACFARGHKPRSMRAGFAVAHRDDPTSGSRRCSTGWWATSSPSSRRGPRPRATGSPASGILPGAQIVFVDTPGLHRGGGQLGRSCGPRSTRAVEEVDLVCVVVDATDAVRPRRARARARCATYPVPVFCVLNKVDRVRPKSRLLPLIEPGGRPVRSSEILPISALDGTNCDRLLRADRRRAARTPGPVSRRTPPAISRRRSTWPR